MAEHNIVHIYGSVLLDPQIITDDETKEYKRATLWLNTMRSSRPYEDRNESNEIKTDQIMVLSQNAEIVKKLATVKQYDIVIMKATLNTRNVNKTMLCTECGQKFSVNATSENSQTDSSMLTFLSPICVDVREHGLNADDAKRRLMEYREMSNEVMMIGNLCGPVKRVEKGHASSYQLGIDRKFYLRDDDPSVRADYPYVRVFGEQADKDFKYLKKGSMVLIDGMIQNRKFTRKTKCPHCGNEIEWKNSVLEVVPYATEYLQNYITPDEYEKLQAEKAERAEQAIFGHTLASNTENLSN